MSKHANEARAITTSLLTHLPSRRLVAFQICARHGGGTIRSDRSESCYRQRLEILKLSGVFVVNNADFCRRSGCRHRRRLNYTDVTDAARRRRAVGVCRTGEAKGAARVVGTTAVDVRLGAISTKFMHVAEVGRGVGAGIGTADGPGVGGADGL